jgi:hypothetical protein
MMPRVPGVLWLVCAAVSSVLSVLCLFSGNASIGVAAAFLAVLSVLGLATGND